MTNKQIWEIADIKINSPYFLAPMAGYTDKYFRAIIRQFSCGLVYTEMVSVAGLVHRDKKTPELMNITANDHPVAVQLFGSNPADFFIAVKKVKDTGADFIDINFGCPVRKVSKQGAGAALMKDPDRVKKIIREAVRSTDLPVTVKFRSGWDKQNINILELSKIAEGEGVAAICIHPRTRSQGFCGEADWSLIEKVKSKILVPIIGSGDICCLADAKEKQAKTGCDFVMIGRSAVQFFIPEHLRLLKLKEHIENFIRDKGEKSFSQMRKFVALYVKGLPGAAKIRALANQAKSSEEFLL